MQRETASAPLCAAVVAEVMLATPAECPPPQPAAGSEIAAIAARVVTASEWRQRSMIRTVERPSTRRVARERCLSPAAQR
jgi:hypothetical protein